MEREHERIDRSIRSCDLPCQGFGNHNQHPSHCVVIYASRYQSFQTYSPCTDGSQAFQGWSLVANYAGNAG